MILPVYLLLFIPYWLVLAVVYRPRRGVSWIAVLASLVGGYLVLASLDLALLAAMIAMVVTSQVCRGRKVPHRRFLGYAAAVMGLVVVLTIPRSLEIAGMLRRHPGESLVERLTPKVSSTELQSEPALNAASRQFVEDLHMELQRVGRSRAEMRWRSLAELDALHESALKIFQDAPGFGVSRVRRIPIRKKLIDLPELVAVPLPALRESSSTSAEEVESFVEQLPSDMPTATLEGTHVRSVAEFSNPLGFGYVPSTNRYPQWGKFRSNLEHVVGFQTHGFRQLPKVADGRLSQFTSSEVEKAVATWEVERLDLVSLLLNDPPAVYVSENLPNMGELRAAPKRPPSEFENAALQRLRNGEALVAKSSSHTIRLLGAIRATESCLACHDVKQGRMLGAFSYVLRRKTPLPSAQLRLSRRQPLS